MALSSTLKKIRTILASHTAREVMVFGFFVILSAAAWLLQVLHDNFSLDVSVPLALEDVPEGVIITDSIPGEITVKANDKGTTLMAYLIDNRRDSLRISFADYNTSRPIGTVFISTSSLQKQIQKYLPPSADIVRVLTDTIRFSYNRGVSRRLPVKFNGTLKTRKNHTIYVHSISIQPDCVTVYAPIAALDTMTHIATMPTDISDIRTDMTFNARLAEPEGMKCIPGTVQTHLHIDAYTEKSVEVPITGINFPAGKQLRTFPTKVTVTFRVGMAYYNTITADMFAITVSYEDIIKTNRCRLRLKSTPDRVSNARLSQNEVDFVIEQIAE